MIKTSELYEGVNLKGFTPKEIENNKKLYEYLVNSANKANFLNEGIDDEIDEGMLTGLLGAAAGGLIGPTIGKVLCKVLGVNEQGTLGKLFTSSLVTSAIGYELGA
jgi:uncharacterized membrane protein YeaQ/YmgE (transglycosylase-associated protein family)